MEISSCYRSSGSFDRLISNLAAKANVLLSTPVLSVSYGGRLACDDGAVSDQRTDEQNGLVHVTTADGKLFRSRRVVVTPSTPSLAAADCPHKISFSPGLPTVQRALLDGVKSVISVKVLLKFSCPIWAKTFFRLVLSGGVLTDVSFHVTSAGRTGDTSSYYCIGRGNLECGSVAVTDDELIKSLLNDLDEAFSSAPAAALHEQRKTPSRAFVAGEVHRSRGSECFTFSGSFVPAPAKTATCDADELWNTTLADKVFFAEQQRAAWACSGDVFGSWTAGTLVAQRVLQSLQAPRLVDSLDRYFRHSGAHSATVVGFGSLLSEASARTTFPNLNNFRVVRVKGYRRVFAHSPSVFVERGLASPGSMSQASLSAEPVFKTELSSDGTPKTVRDTSVGFLAVCFSVPLDDMEAAMGSTRTVGGRQWCGEALLKREEEFNFDIVPCYTALRGAADPIGDCDEIDSIPGLMCVASTDEEYIERWGLQQFNEKTLRTGLNRIWNWPQDAALKPCPVYFSHCYAAAGSLGSHVLDSFLDETFLVDRTTTVRDYVNRNPDIMFVQPPPMHESRYMSALPPSSPARKIKDTENNNSTVTNGDGKQASPDTKSISFPAALAVVAGLSAVCAAIFIVLKRANK